MPLLGGFNQTNNFGITEDRIVHTTWSFLSLYPTGPYLPDGLWSYYRTFRQTSKRGITLSFCIFCQSINLEYSYSYFYNRIATTQWPCTIAPSHTETTFLTSTIWLSCAPTAIKPIRAHRNASFYVCTAMIFTFTATSLTTFALQCIHSRRNNSKNIPISAKTAKAKGPSWNKSRQYATNQGQTSK